MLAHLVLLILGMASTYLGYLYLFQPARIFQLHSWLRELFLNDAYINLRRKQIGSFFLIVGIIFLANFLFR